MSPYQEALPFGSPLKYRISIISVAFELTKQKLLHTSRKQKSISIGRWFICAKLKRHSVHSHYWPRDKMNRNGNNLSYWVYGYKRHRSRFSWIFKMTNGYCPDNPFFIWFSLFVVLRHIQRYVGRPIRSATSLITWKRKMDQSSNIVIYLLKHLCCFIQCFHLSGTLARLVAKQPTIPCITCLVTSSCC